MSKILDFFRRNKYAFLWTVCYVLIMWAILHWMFNFNIFSGAHWVRLAHAQLHGFPGFVFGIMILAALPLYIATTLIVIRNKAPLIKISLPKFLSPVPADTVKAEIPPTPVATPDVDAAKTTPAPSDEYTRPLPPGLPSEIRTLYARARAGINTAPKSRFDMGNITSGSNVPNATVPELQPAGELPLPNDFEFGNDTSANEFSTPTFTPVFTDMTFDEDAPTSDEQNVSDTSLLQTDDLTPITAALTARDIPFTTENGIIITNDMAIAVHNDSEFWVADNEVWFAAGRQKTSPVAAVKGIATARSIRPILYLGQTNILDLDTQRAKWESDGITVITTPDDLK